jgi:hypothetical protein
MRSPTLLAALAALSLACGRPILSAQAEVERISVTTAPVAFPDLYLLGPVAAHLDPALFSTVVALDYDLGDVPTHEKGVTPELELTGFVLHLRSTAVRKPDALRELEVVLVDPATAATTLVASYVKGAGPTPADVVFRVPGTDLMPFVNEKKLSARLRIVFDPADLPNAFEASPELDFRAQVTIDYTKL